MLLAGVYDCVGIIAFPATVHFHVKRGAIVLKLPVIVVGHDAVMRLKLIGMSRGAVLL